MYDPLEARKWGRVALMVLYVPIYSHGWTQKVPCAARGRQRNTHRVNFDDRLKAVLGQLGDRRQEVPSSTYMPKRHVSVGVYFDWKLLV